MPAVEASKSTSPVEVLILKPVEELKVPVALLVGVGSETLSQ